MSRLTRRAFSLAVAALAVPPRAEAMGRIPVGGTLRLHVPWSTRVLDPHDLFDALGALFGAAVADPLYALDADRRPYPALADGMPRLDGGDALVRLRPGLRTAANKPLDARDVVASLARARSLGAAGLLAELPVPTVDGTDRLTARFAAAGDAERLALLLASPLAAVLPAGFSPFAPDGTGAFRARCSPDRLELERNPNASRGAAFLEHVTVVRARDTAEPLRAFEAGEDDVGWLGLGLHQARPGAVRFDFGEVGWLVLATGTRAASHGAPGVAQQLADAVPVERLQLGLRPRPGPRLESGARWGGGAAEILFDEDAAHARIVAEAVAAKLSQPGHVLTPAAVARDGFRAARASGDFTLAVDVVRDPMLGDAASRAVALATADRKELGRELGRRPPKIAPATPAHRATGSLRLGVLGGLGVSGGAARDVQLVAQPAGVGLELGSSHRTRAR
jgi:peptide/nickel transport system substrate-binding protein